MPAGAGEAFGTHGFDQDQRFLELSFVQSEGVYTVQGAVSPGEAPPGHYMLFAIRDVIEADGFVRHYEDAARIIQALDRLPPIDTPAVALAGDMLADKDIAATPSADDPSLMLDDALKRAAVERAYVNIAPMFWGARMALDDACATIRGWVEALRG